MRLRLDNLGKARRNHELIALELDRIKSKVTSIAELAINRQDSNFISGEVDGVAAHLVLPRWIVMKDEVEPVRVACATPVPGTSGNGVVDAGEGGDTGNR